MKYSSGNISQVKDNQGRTVEYVYDASLRLRKATGADGGVTEYTYDESGQLLTIKETDGNTLVANEYDSRGRVAKQSLGGKGKVAYSFDYVTDPHGNTVRTNITDSHGNLESVTFSGSFHTITTQDQSR